MGVFQRSQGYNDMNIQKNLRVILEELGTPLKSLSDKTVENFVADLQRSPSIFFFAQGRAGYILRCFCMRLMHMGFQVFFCGDTNTPAITQDDLLIVLSGSGETPWTLEAVRSGKKENAHTFGILGNPVSRIGSLVDQIIHLPGTTKLRLDGEPYSRQIAGSLFEQSAFLFFEAVVLGLYREKREDNGYLLTRHTNIE